MRFIERHPALILILGGSLAIMLGLMMVVAQGKPPGQGIGLVLVFMASSVTFSLVLAYTLYRLGIFHRFHSLRWTLTVSVIFSVLIVLINVWITSRMMLINDDDVALITALLAFSGLAAVAFGVFIANAVTDGIRELASANQRLADGKLDTRLTIKGQDEISQLAHTFNQMAERLQAIDAQKHELDQARRELVAGVSHDLRTPLTSMRVLIEAVLDGVVDDPDTVRRYLQTAQMEIHHLSSVIDDLFELAQVDAGVPLVQRTPTAIQDLLEEMVEIHTPMAEQRGICIHADYPPDLQPIPVDGGKIQRVLHNLMENALRFTNDNGEIRLSAAMKGRTMEVEVYNSGSQIAESDLPYVFDRFYRAERSRTIESNGSGSQRRNVGLGLAVARGMVQAHAGVIWIETVEQGTAFRFALPWVEPEPAH